MNLQRHIYHVLNIYYAISIKINNDKTIKIYVTKC